MVKVIMIVEMEVPDTTVITPGPVAGTNAAFPFPGSSDALHTVVEKVLNAVPYFKDTKVASLTGLPGQTNSIPDANVEVEVRVTNVTNEAQLPPGFQWKEISPDDLYKLMPAQIAGNILANQPYPGARLGVLLKDCQRHPAGHMITLGYRK